MLISPAFAQDATDAAATATGGITDPGFLMSMLPLVLIFFVFYAMVIRPQNKRLIEHRQTINNLQKGDKVVTGGGLVAKVVKLHGEDEVILEIADGVQVHAMRHTIMMMRNPAPKIVESKKA